MPKFSNSAFYLVCLFALLFACRSATVVAQSQTESATTAIAGASIEEIKVWSAGLPPDATIFPEAKVEQLEEKNINARCLFYVQDPSLMVFHPADEIATGCSVIICPGGGYTRCCYKHEGIEMARWLNSIGVTAFVLKYRVPRRTKRFHWEPMQDLQRSIRLVRTNAKQWDIDPERVGVLGFSAGGHLALMAGLNSATETYTPRDQIDQVDRAPNFMCPIYASYMGNGYRNDKAELGDLIRVTEDSPPTFMAVTGDDKMRGAQSALLFAKLREHGVPAELHAYASGGHGYGIQQTGKPVAAWNLQLEAWLKDQQWLTRPKANDKTDPKVGERKTEH